MKSSGSVVHLTSVHPRSDTRIFVKQCRSLAAAGYRVGLVVADGEGDDFNEGIAIYDVGIGSGRLDRIVNVTRRVFCKALCLEADIYHLHDPELLPMGLKLIRAGRKVIFDAHEDVPKQLLSKPYLGPYRFRAISLSYAAYEKRACRKLSAIIAATPTIRDRFLRINGNTVDINNYPILQELHSESSWASKEAEVCYVGRISEIRGIRETVAALGEVKSPAKLNLCGRFANPLLEAEVKKMPGWAKVNEYGFVDRRGVRAVLARSLGGVVNLHPTLNYMEALPVKMFEYMAAGIPTISSEFPIWRQIVEGEECGICVDPLDPSALARAIDFLVSHPEEAQRMGEQGRRAVEERYNWKREQEKLLQLYEKVLAS